MMFPIGRRVLRLILPVVAFLVFAPPVLPADAVKIMPLGDSITKGTGSVHGWGYREPLYVLLSNDGYNFDFVGSYVNGSFPDPNHEGHYGWRADEILNGRPSDPCAGKLEYWLSADQPDVVMLHIGTNDISQGSYDANEVNGILNVIDAYEVANNKHVTVILALIINRRIDSPATKRAWTTQFNSDVNVIAANRIANEDDIIVVNMESALDYSIGVDMDDEVHPNDNGYIKMAGVWYAALTGFLVPQKTLTCSSTEGGSVTQPGEGVFHYDQNAVVGLAAAADSNYHFVNWTGTAVDAGKAADPNSAGTTVTMDADYTVLANFAPGEENILKEINQRLELRTSGRISDFESFYTANGWSLDVTKDFEVKVNFHYGQTSEAEGWTGISIGDDANYVSISAGSDGNASYFYYEAAVDGSVVSEKELRTSSDGTLYITYDANSTARKFYLSHTGFGSEYADVWQATNPTQGQWALPVYVSVGGGSSAVVLSPGDAYLDNFEMKSAGLLDWPPATDIDANGFIEILDLGLLCDNWLGSGQGDIDSNGTADFLDLSELGLAW
jgi:lysophospholipase L1-like esterase